MNSSIIKNILKAIVKDKERRHKIIVSTTSWIPDRIYLKILYLFICKKRLPIDSPVSFNEKIQWYKLNYRDPLMTICADKYAVREFVEQQGFQSYLVPLVAVYNSAAEIDFYNIPERCILKTTHNSSGSYKWDSSRDNDINKIRNTFNNMMNINAYWLSREWAYKKISPKIVCEEWVDSYTPIIDVKFLCFNGKAKYIYFDIGMNDDFGNHAIGHRAVLNRDFSEIDVKTSMRKLDLSKIELPNCMDKLLQIADKLSLPFPHVRVDFFIADNRPYFSELTFYSGGGYGTFDPPEWDIKIGKSFILPDLKEISK